MKQPKKLTRQQKIMLSNQGIDPRLYALNRETPEAWFLVEKATGIIYLVLKKRKD